MRISPRAISGLRFGSAEMNRDQRAKALRARGRAPTSALPWRCRGSPAGPVPGSGATEEAGLPKSAAAGNRLFSRSAVAGFMMIPRLAGACVGVGVAVGYRSLTLFRSQGGRDGDRNAMRSRSVLVHRSRNERDPLQVHLLLSFFFCFDLETSEVDPTCCLDAPV
jgi:hypothetical protein